MSGWMFPLSGSSNVHFSISIKAAFVCMFGETTSGFLEHLILRVKSSKARQPHNFTLPAHTFITRFPAIKKKESRIN